MSIVLVMVCVGVVLLTVGIGSVGGVGAASVSRGGKIDSGVGVQPLAIESSHVKLFESSLV